MKILLVKLSSLGDVVHTMPAVQDIRQAMPQAQIDWVVEAAFAPLVRRCQGVGRVIESDLRRLRKSPLSRATRAAWRAFRADLQHVAYDAVIDLQGLTKSAVVSRLARLAPQGKRYALANRTEGSSYEAPTRWVADVSVPIQAHTAAVQRSRELCARALGFATPVEVSFGLFAHGGIELFATNSISSDFQRKNDPATAIVDQVLPLRPAVALVHGTSRADKQWPLEHWRALGLRLNQAGFRVVLPHGSDAEQRTCQAIAHALPSAEVWPRLGLDALTDALAQCAGVIGVDSGLSHIAVALNLPHVQIYNFDTAWRTGPQHSARQVSVFAAPCPTLDAVWQAWLGVLEAGLPLICNTAASQQIPVPKPQ